MSTSDGRSAPASSLDAVASTTSSASRLSSSSLAVPAIAVRATRRRVSASPVSIGIERDAKIDRDFLAANW